MFFHYLSSLLTLYKYLWDLFRDRNSGNFTLSNTTKLDIAHTNYVQAICYDSDRDLLYTGGADNRMFIYDMATQSLQAQSKYLRRVSRIKFYSWADGDDTQRCLLSRLTISFDHRATPISTWWCKFFTIE